ncbi:hypothetical protein [Wenzhouxiangella sp. EGI_FJ10409]|uniref:hypothetical protein n=1 Tax=Wenzhouxiangella sp. EGI_FJ10409 TaxID=3243767 RepID=UPI0035E21D9E
MPIDCKKWCICAVLLLCSFSVSGGTVGRVIKVEEGVGYAVYEVVATWEVPGVSEEPSAPGDLEAYSTPPIGGPWCDEDNICYDPHSASPPPQLHDPWVGDRITVIGMGVSFASLGTMFPRLSIGGGGGGGGTPGEPDLRVRPDPPDLPCDSQNSDLNSEKEFLEDLFEDSNFSEFRAGRERSGYAGIEQAGFILPDGTTIDLGAIGALINQTACGFGFDASVMEGLTIPDGSIFVHTHPWSNGDDQEPACGPPDGGAELVYRPGPGTFDDDALTSLQQFYGVNIIGVVIDGDQLTIFDENGDVLDESNRCY